MDVLDRLRLGQRQEVVVALQVALARQKPLAAEMALGEAERLDLRAHRPVENKNPALRRFAQRFGGVLPMRKGGVEDGVERRTHWPRSGLGTGHNHINMSLYGRQPRPDWTQGPNGDAWRVEAQEGGGESVKPAPWATAMRKERSFGGGVANGSYPVLSCRSPSVPGCEVSANTGRSRRSGERVAGLRLCQTECAIAQIGHAANTGGVVGGMPDRNGSVAVEGVAQARG